MIGYNCTIQIQGFRRTFRVSSFASFNPYDCDALNSYLLRIYANYTDQMSRQVLFNRYTVIKDERN